MWEFTEDKHAAIETIAMIRKLKPDQQASILGVPQIREALIKAGQGKAVEQIYGGFHGAATPPSLPQPRSAVLTAHL